MSHKQERQFGFLFAAVFTIIAFWPLHAPNLYWLAGAWVLFALFCTRLLAALDDV